MTVPYAFGSATSAIPLSQLDSNFNTPITLGNTAIQLGNTVTTLNNMTLANVTISSVATAITAAQGGTGLTASGANGNVLTSNGTTWVSQAASAGTNITNGTSNVTIASANGSITAATNGTTALTIDTSQNMGLGVTPSAWGSSFKALELPAGSSLITNSSDYVGLISNAYNNGTSWLYKSTAPAGRYLVSQNSHQWYSAASGTAGNAITFTQAMTLDASGNLGIGTSSPAQKLDISAAGAQIALRSTDTTAARLRGYVNGSESGVIGFLSGGGQYFETVGTERMRLDASGNLLVGTTSTGFTSSNSTYYSPGAAYWINNHATGTASGTRYIGFGIGITEIGSITQNGTTGVLYNITSDYRLKDVTGAVTGFGERIDALKPVDYTWKADGSAARGFLAHEFQSVYANSVTGTKDAVDDEGNPVYQQMQASTTEVIADLVAELQSLRKRVAQLEGAK